MTLFSDLKSTVLSDLNASTNSSLFPSATVESAINRAYIKLSRLFRWPALEDAKMTSTALNQPYYDSPEGWSPNSMYRLEIDDDLYGEDPDGSPMDFNDYLTWKENNPNSTEKKWSVQNLRFFVSPTPTAVGSNNISIWGQKVVTLLSSASDTTIWSKNMPECNEAIVLEAEAILRQKGDSVKTVQTGDDILSAQAKQIVLLAFGRLKAEKSKIEKTQPFLDVPDFFGPNTVKQITGGF